MTAMICTLGVTYMTPTFLIFFPLVSFYMKFWRHFNLAIFSKKRKGQLVVWLWTLKMVYWVPTRYLLIQLQLVNHFFNSLTNEKGVSGLSNKKSVAMHNSII